MYYTASAKKQITWQNETFNIYVKGLNEQLNKKVAEYSPNILNTGECRGFIGWQSTRNIELVKRAWPGIHNICIWFNKTRDQKEYIDFFEGSIDNEPCVYISFQTPAILNYITTENFDNYMFDIKQLIGEAFFKVQDACAKKQAEEDWKKTPEYAKMVKDIEDWAARCFVNIGTPPPLVYMWQTYKTRWPKKEYQKYIEEHYDWKEEVDKWNKEITDLFDGLGRQLDADCREIDKEYALDRWERRNSWQSSGPDHPCEEHV